MTLFYVFVGCAMQFVIGTGLAFLCSQPITGRTFFRVIFFIPLMITPIGIGYAMRMVADITKGPFAPVWQWLGLGDFAWASDPWAARLFIVIGNSWQWIPFIFICCWPPSRTCRAIRSRRARWTAPAAGKSSARSPGRRSCRLP